MPDYQEKSWANGGIFQAAEATEMSRELNEQEGVDLSQDAQIALLTTKVAALEAVLAHGFMGDDRIPGENVSARRSQMGGATSLISGDMFLTYFTAQESGPKNNIVVMSGSQAVAGNAPTLIRMGLWRVESNGTLTRLATTANDLTLFAATFTEYTKSLSETVVFAAGQRYAWGPLIVTTGTAPNIVSSPAIRYQAHNLGPRTSARIPSLADLPNGISSTPGGTAGSLWARFTA